MGWLHLQPGDWRATLQRQVEARDKMDDPHHSGPAPAFMTWVAEVQLPALARQPHYRRQFDDRISELEMLAGNLDQQITQGRLDLEPAAGLHRAEIKRLEALL